MERITNNITDIPERVQIPSMKSEKKTAKRTYQKN